MKKNKTKESEIIYRQPTLDDIDKLCELEKNVWGEEMGANREKWESRINIFSEGIFLAEENGCLIGSSVLHRVCWNYRAGEFPTWQKITANGYITNHDSNGDVLYGVNMSVISGHPGVARIFTSLAVQLKNKYMIQRGLLGVRVPTLKRYIRKKGIAESRLTPKMVLSISRKDPEVRFFCSYDNLRAIAAKQDYYLVDKESLGWGIILEVTK